MSLNMNYWLSEELQLQEKDQLNALLGNLGQTVPQGMDLPESPKSFPENFSRENLMRLPLIKLVKCLSAVRLHVAIPVQVPEINNSSAAQY